MDIFTVIANMPIFLPIVGLIIGITLVALGIMSLIHRINRRHQLFSDQGDKVFFYDDNDDRKSGVIVDCPNGNEVIIYSFGKEYTRNRDQIFKL